MDAAVVVPAYNERTAVVRALDALADQGAAVVVVVGGDDGTEAAARDHPATDRVVRDAAEDGPAAARNRGARAASAEVVCFTDADTVVPPGWVARHLSHYHDDRVVGVGGPLRPLDGSRTDEVLFKLLSDYWYRVSWPVGFVQASGNNCSYRREAFLAAGGFDESLPFMEDTDCSLRMRARGRLVYDPHAWVHTSVRRQREEGYGGLFLRYAVGYARYALGRDPGEGYFRDW
ncbi:glycosyltransferase family 2 protein [Halomarina halobia]|uniref:Glycosyltransferase family 2 protein n=1 Tax=Halomarina halobia TaxID=3033386 RepID=A0ABD6A6K9_9EURY|nr:glycosyltransferase [Halomarina sp. PSR21]